MGRCLNCRLAPVPPVNCFHCTCGTGLSVPSPCGLDHPPGRCGNFAVPRTEKQVRQHVAQRCLHCRRARWAKAYLRKAAADVPPPNNDRNNIRVWDALAAHRREVVRAKELSGCRPPIEGEVMVLRGGHHKNSMAQEVARCRRWIEVEDGDWAVLGKRVTCKTKAPKFVGVFNRRPIGPRSVPDRPEDYPRQQMVLPRGPFADTFWRAFPELRAYIHGVLTRNGLLSQRSWDSVTASLMRTLPGARRQLAHMDYSFDTIAAADEIPVAFLLALDTETRFHYLDPQGRAQTLSLDPLDVVFFVPWVIHCGACYNGAARSRIHGYVLRPGFFDRPEDQTTVLMQALDGLFDG